MRVLHHIIFSLFSVVITHGSQTMKIPMKGGISAGEYYVSVTIGTPIQSFNLQVDTGSSSTIIPSKAINRSNCTNCVTPNTYNLQASTSGATVPCTSGVCGSGTCGKIGCASTMNGVITNGPCESSSTRCCSIDNPSDCGFYLQYGGGNTARGSLASDYLTMLGISEKVYFGVVSWQSGMWQTQTDGILGLAYQPLDCNPTCVTPVFDSLTSSGTVANIFSMCMGDNGGYLVLGASDSTLYTGSILYTPLVQQNYYVVSMFDMSVNDNSIFVDIASTSTTNNDMVIIDSGTTMLLLSSKYYTPLVNFFRTHYSTLPGVSGAQSVFSNVCLVQPPSSLWPTIDLYLAGVLLSLPPELYFVNVPQSDGRIMYCFGIAQIPAALDSYNIIGGTVLRGYHTIFDRANQQIGFGAVNAQNCGSKIAGVVNTAVFPSSFSDELRTGLWTLLIFVSVVAAGVLLVYGGRYGWKYFSKPADVDTMEDAPYDDLGTVNEETMSLKAKQILAIRQMLNFNDTEKTGEIDSWSDQWKVLILDSFCMDVLSPLLTVADLRKLGVTLHMNINDKREDIPDVPAIYFLLPTLENIRLIGEDLKTPLYREFHINFASMVSRSQLETLGTLSVEACAVNLVKKVFDQYMNYVALEAKLFSLNIKSSLSRYNDPKKEEASVMEYVDQVVDGLFAAIATMGVVPIIRAKSGTAAEMAATKLDKKIKDYISNGSSLFNDRGGVSSFSRPVLLILDRETDYVTMLHHNSTYQALSHDLLDLKNNCVNVNIKKGSTVSKKTYHLDGESDEFWNKFAGSSFPEAVQNNDKELQAISIKENSIRSTTTIEGSGEGKFDIHTGMKDLMSVTDSLPQLLEKKKKLEMHTNILSATMEKIAQRNLPTFYEVEEQLVMSGLISDKVLFDDLINNPSKGNLEDKIRLLSVALLSSEVDNIAGYEKALSSLSETLSSSTLAEGDFLVFSRALQYLKKHKTFHFKPKKGLLPPSSLSSSLPSDSAASNALNMGFSLANSLLAKATAQVKTFLPGSKRLAATNLLDAVMENTSSPLSESFIYLDPKYRGGKGGGIPRQTTSFKEGVVFMIGGGCYSEYQNIQDYAASCVPAKQVIYGCTEILSSNDFLKQLGEMSP